MLSQAVTIGDIHDAEGFVAATINRVGLRLTDHEREELTAEGLRILCSMHVNYKPGFGGRNPATSRFNGYAAQFLPGKLSDAWHRMHEHHRLRTNDSTGKREWVYDQRAVSMTTLEVDTESFSDGPAQFGKADRIPALQAEDTHTDLAHTLAAALDEQWAHERAITLRLAILLATGYTLPQATTKLGIRTTEAKDATDRIRKVSHRLEAA